MQTVHYSATDIERYYKGGMTPAEMHALEKAALDDPFLADALDGYVHAKTPAADAAFLKEEIARRSRTVVPMMGNRRVALSVAALLILLAGFGWLAYQFNDTNKNVVAVRTTTPAGEQTQAPVTDSSPKIPEGTVAMKPPVSEPQNNTTSKISRKKEEPAPGKTAAPLNEFDEGNTSAAGEQTFSKPHVAAAPMAKSVETASIASVKSANTFQAQVVDEHNQPVPFAFVTKQNSITSVLTDSAGKFSMMAPDSALVINVNVAGYKAQTDTLHLASNDVAIVIRRNEEAMSEVVVVGLGKRKKNDRVQLKSVEPLTGWNRFNEYVDQNLIAPEKQDAQIKNGEVLLSFDVDAKGNAANITVEKPLCAACDTTAVRLIQQGSKWKKTKEGKAQARIRF